MTTQPTVAIVYASIHHANTRKLAELLAEELLADLYTVDEIDQADLTQYDGGGLGSGIYVGRNHTTLLKQEDSWQKSTGKAYSVSKAGLRVRK